MARVNPLNINVPIIDPRKGTPTPQFMQTWAQALATFASITSITTAAEMSAALDLIGHTEGDILIRGSSLWETLGRPTAPTTKFLRGDGTWAVVASSPSLASLTDVSIPSPVDRQVLTYDVLTSKWEAFTPGIYPAPKALKWRALIGPSANGGPNMGFNTMEMHGVPGGPQLCTSTALLTVSATSFGNKNNLLANSPAVNNFWVAPVGVTQWIEYDFPTPTSINEFQFMMAQDSGGNGPGAWPQDLAFQYWDGAAWVTAWSVTAQSPSPNTTVPIVYTRPGYSVTATLAGLGDVSIPAPTDAQLLTYDTASLKWKAKTPNDSLPKNPTSTKWRIIEHGTNGNPLFALSMIQMKAIPGGANLSNNPALGSVSSTYSGYNQNTLWNGSLTNFIWTSNTNEWAEYDFPTAVSINEVVLRAYVGSGAGITAWPNPFDVQYWNGSAWVTAWTVTGSTITADGQTVVFTDPSYGHDKLVNLRDVLITSIADKQLLTWNATDSKWENKVPAQVTEAGITLANNTTNDVSITKHGLAPILPNDATKFFNGLGGYTTPPGTFVSAGKWNCGFASYGAFSSGAAAMKGIVFTLFDTISIDKIAAQVSGTAGEVYGMIICACNTGGGSVTISSVAGATPTQTIAVTKRQTLVFTFPSTVVMTAGTRYYVALVITSGTTTTALAIGVTATATQPLWDGIPMDSAVQFNDFAQAGIETGTVANNTQSPAAGTAVATGSSAGYCIYLHQI